MAQDIVLKLRVSDDGSLALLDTAGDKLLNLGQSAKESQGGLASFVQGATELKSAFDIISGSLKQAEGLIDNVNNIGVASLRAKAGFDALGGSVRILDDMRAATHGLVDNTKLMQDATFALGSGAAKSVEQLAEMDRIGATLGLTFKGSAEQGIDAFTMALEHVGQKRSLMTLGIDAQEVEAKFKSLKATMNDQDAWQMAVFDVAGKQADKLAGALDGAGTAFERLKTRATDAIQQMAENVAIGINATIDLIDALQKKAQGDEIAKAIQIRDSGGALGHEARLALMNANMPTTAQWNGQNGDLMSQNFWGQAQPTGNRQQLYDMANPIREVVSIFQNMLTADYRDTPDYQHKQNQAEYQAQIERSIQDNRENSHEYIEYRNQYLKDNQDAAGQAQAEMFAKARDIFNHMKGGWVDLQVGFDNFIQGFKQVVNNQSLAEAFHTGNGGIGGEMGGSMEQNVNAQRQQLARRYGANSKQVQEYDAQSKQAIDEYRIATGQATRESIAFDDAKSNLDKRFASGKMSVTDYTKDVLMMAEAAKTGKTSLQDIYDLQIKMGQLKAPDWWTKQHGGEFTDQSAEDEHQDMRKKGVPWSVSRRGPNTSWLDNELDQRWKGSPGGGNGPGGLGFSQVGTAAGGVTGITGSFDQAKKHAEDATVATQHLAFQAALTAGAMQISGMMAAASFNPIIKQASATQGTIRGIGSALSSLDGKTVTMRVNVSGGGGGRLGNPF